MHTYFRLLQYVFLAVIAPAIISFAYSLATDPAVPELVRALGKIVKARFLARLSRLNERALHFKA